MIQKTQSFTSSDGAIHPTLEDAQRAEVEIILHESTGCSADDSAWGMHKMFATAVVKEADRIKDVLTTRPSSRPKQRKVNGFVATKRGRKPAAKPASEAQATA